jgi:hypothetical protein
MVATIANLESGSSVRSKLNSVITSALVPTAIKTANYNAVAGDLVVTDSSASPGSFTITLPGSPLHGDTIGILDGTDSWDTGPITIARNGNNIEGLSEDLLLSGGRLCELRFIDGHGWSLAMLLASATPATGLVEQFSGHIETVANKTYVLDLKAPYAYTINSLAAKTVSGTCTAKLTIDGVNVTGITALAVTSTEDFDDATAANVVGVGNTVALVVSSNSTALDLQFTVKYTR